MRRRDRERGASLIGLLMTLIVLGGIAAVAAVAASSMGGSSGLEDVGSAQLGAVAPAAPRSVTGAASEVACAAGRRVIEAALDTYRTLHGGQATDISGLVAAGFLRDGAQLNTQWALDPATGALGPVAGGPCS